MTGERWKSRRWLCGDELTGVFPSWIPAHGAVLGTGASPELCPDTTLGCCRHRAGLTPGALGWLLAARPGTALNPWREPQCPGLSASHPLLPKRSRCPGSFFQPRSNNKIISQSKHHPSPELIAPAGGVKFAAASLATVPPWGSARGCCSACSRGWTCTEPGSRANPRGRSCSCSSHFGSSSSKSWARGILGTVRVAAPLVPGVLLSWRLAWIQNRELLFSL